MCFSLCTCFAKGCCSHIVLTQHIPCSVSKRNKHLRINSRRCKPKTNAGTLLLINAGIKTAIWTCIKTSRESYYILLWPRMYWYLLSTLSSHLFNKAAVLGPVYVLGNQWHLLVSTCYLGLQCEGSWKSLASVHYP